MKKNQETHFSPLVFLKAIQKLHKFQISQINKYLEYNVEFTRGKKCKQISDLPRISNSALTNIKCCLIHRANRATVAQNNK